MNHTHLYEALKKFELDAKNEYADFAANNQVKISLLLNL